MKEEEERRGGERLLPLRRGEAGRGEETGRRRWRGKIREKQERLEEEEEQEGGRCLLRRWNWVCWFHNQRRAVKPETSDDHQT